MGCCNSGEVQTVRDSFDQAWQVFKGTDLARPERFLQNRQRVFRFLFLSIVLPQTKQTRDRVNAFGEKLPKDSRALGEVRREMARLDEEIVKLEEQRRVLHQDFAKRIKSDMISVEEVPKSLAVRDHREQEEKMYPRGGSHAGAEPSPNAPMKQSVSEMHQSHIRSSYEEYSIPLTAMDSMLDPRDSEDMPRAESSNQHTRNERLIQALEFQSDRRKALEIQVQALYVQLEQQKGEMLRLEEIRSALLKELGEKQEIIEKLKNEQAAVRLQEEIIELRRDKEEMEDKVAEMQLQLEQFRGEVARLDREREQALSENKYLCVKVKDLGETLNQTANEDSCNVSMSILPQLAPPRKPALALLPCVIQERVEPSSRISEQSKMDRSFIMVEEQGQGEGKAEQLNGYSILFNLFPNSKVLPSHADFQAAVGMRTIIADLFQRRPLKSQLLFSFDPITPNHFAKYIENRQNLLLLVGLPNGITLGGFAGNFTGENELTDSFLFSLDPHREPMKLTPAPGRKVRRIDIDPGQLVFGNGELRVRAKSFEVGSSVGCFQSLFCWGKRAVPVEKFLGTSERTLMATAYEIHQLHFA